MKGLKFTAASFLIAAGVLGAHAAQANDTVVFAGAGASALYNSTLQGAKSYFSGGGNSGLNSKVATINDTTSGTTVTNIGNAWVAWDSQPAGSRRVAYYVSIDATVGTRSFFNKDTVTWTSAFLATLPSDVAAAIQASSTAGYGAGNQINTAGASIRIEDTLVSTARAWASGYDITTPIKDAGGNTSVPIAFDPTSRTYQDTALGAVPLIVFVNSSSTATVKSGSTVTASVTPALASLTNVNSHDLVALYSGEYSNPTTDLLGVSTVAPLTLFLHDPISGNHQAFEWELPASQQYSTSQESGVTASNGTNPLNEANIGLLSSDTNSYTKASVGGRVRAIGLSQVINAVNSTPNSLAYGFWSNSNYTASSTNNNVNPAPNTRYVTLDGVDPLQPSYTGGVYPSTPTFDHIKDGTYRAWSILHIITEGTPSTDEQGIINGTVSSDNGGNFAPSSSLSVFHSHRAVNIVNAKSKDVGTYPTQVINFNVNTPSNGRTAEGEGSEAGSDVGGTVYTDTDESNLGSITGNRL